MRFGVLDIGFTFPDVTTGRSAPAHERLQGILASARLAEELGFDQFSVGERANCGEVTAAPAVLLSAIAASTSRIRLNTGVTILPTTDPVRIAQDYVTADHVSRGRLELRAVHSRCSSRHHPAATEGGEMARYTARRLGQAALVVLAAYTLTFLIVYALPGDPVSVMLAGAAGDGGYVDPEAREALRVELGLDRPLPLQYLDSVLGLLRGDLGTSVTLGMPVRTLLVDSLGPTLALGTAALIIALGLTTVLVLAYFLTPIRWLRTALANIPAAAASAPTFWVGLLLIQVISFRLALLPAIGDRGWQGLVLPALTLGLPAAAGLSQVTLKSLATALESPHVATARASGASRLRLVVRHAGRVAAVPSLTVLGLVVANLVAGAVVVETVFARRGLGRVTATAVAEHDLPVVLGVVLLAALAFVIVNLVTDLLLPLVDPRLSPSLGGAR